MELGYLKCMYMFLIYDRQNNITFNLKRFCLFLSPTLSKGLYKTHFMWSPKRVSN